MRSFGRVTRAGSDRTPTRGAPDSTQPLNRLRRPLKKIPGVFHSLGNFFPIGWPQLMAVYEHGLAYARSAAFYKTTTFWQWMRMPGDIVFAAGALLMAADFVIKLSPLYPPLARLLGRAGLSAEIAFPTHRGLAAGDPAATPN